MLGTTDQARYDDELRAGPQAMTFLSKIGADGERREYCEWCHWHHSLHEQHTYECPPPGTVATTAHRP